MKKRLSKEEHLKEQAQKISIKEGSAYSVMDGFGLRYITPYALTLGASNTHIGILNSLPNLVGSLSELYAIKWMNRISRQKLVFWTVLLQAIMWLGVIGIGAFFFLFNIDHTIAPIALIIVYTLLTIFGTAPVPAWSSWMKDIVPAHYNEYFGIRNRIAGFVALVCMLIAGYLLDLLKVIHIFLGFAVLFVIAFMGRALSAYLFLKQYEPKFVPDHHHLPVWQFVKRLSENSFGKFTLFVSTMNLVVAIAAPFFAVYMLDHLKFSYVQFTIVLLSSAIIMLLVMPAWGKFADLYGNLKITKITGMLIPTIPLLWLAAPYFVNNNPSMLVPYLIAVEAFSGLVWAGFNLATSDFVYDVASPQKIPSFVTYFTILSNLGLFIGALIGGFISSLPFTFIGLPSILVIFLLSGILRFAVAGIMLPRLKEAKRVKRFGLKEAEKQFLHLSFGRVIRILR